MLILSSLLLSLTHTPKKKSTDGVRKEERKCISQILTNISSMRDNVYYLHRHIWNDVQEDWPFYTEQERQILKRSWSTPPRKSHSMNNTNRDFDLLGDIPLFSSFRSLPPISRRKPQNLTPPGSDGGSSTSGQSPSSAHNGSSPPSSGGKRASVANSSEDLGSMPTSKKPRISHYKKDILPESNR